MTDAVPVARTVTSRADAHRVVSLFSGAMGLDLGLEEAGLDVAVCVDHNRDCAATIRHNRPTLPILTANIEDLSVEEVLSAGGLEAGRVFAVVGGPPCQSFSTGGLRATVQDRRGSLFAEFVRMVEGIRPRYFVFENVAQIITAAIRHRPIDQRPGKRWHLSSYREHNEDSRDGSAPLTVDEQAGSAIELILDTFAGLGYTLNFGILNAADFGLAQKRLRFVLLGSRLQSAVSLPTPTHAAKGANGLPPWRTLRDAIGDLREDCPLHSSYSAAFESVFQQVPPGGNWRTLPVELQRSALGDKAFVAGGGKTGFFRRLSWDDPTPTIVGKPNRKSSAICHPSEIRPLSVRECARVQGFPDAWEFVGSMHSQYLQVGNAVPVGLGRAIGVGLLADCERSPVDASARADAPSEWQIRRSSLLDAAHMVLRSAARNKVARRRLPNVVDQGELWDFEMSNPAAGKQVDEFDGIRPNQLTAASSRGIVGD